MNKFLDPNLKFFDRRGNKVNLLFIFKAKDKPASILTQ